MTKKRSEKHKSRSSRHTGTSTTAQHDLLRYAAMGKAKRLHKLLKAHRRLDLDAADAKGDTALHHACRGNHINIARLLLRSGANINAQNADGDTAAHLAAILHNLSLLTTLLQADPAPDVDRRNGHGASVAELADAVLGEEDTRAWDAGAESEDVPPEEAWQQRLKDEAGLAGDFGGGFGETYDAAGVTADADGWDAWAGDEWQRPRASASREQQERRETEDEFAQRIWQEMERRKTRQQQSYLSALEEERNRAAAQRRAAESAVYERSRKVLEEEIGKDRAWRRAVEGGGAATKRAQYEAKWHTFVTNSKDTDIRYTDVPWLAIDAPGENVKAMILYGTDGPAEERKRLRLELLRWHPDKFTGAFGLRLAASDKAMILERVTQISQYLNSLA